MPKNVLIIWAVKKSEELSLLYTVNAESISPSFMDKLNLEIQTYITQESEPPLEDGIPCTIMKSSSFYVIKDNSMYNLVGTRNILWSGAYLVLSTIGFVILFGLMEFFYLKPFGISAWWYKGLLFVVCMVASVIIFGGLVVFFWHQWEKRVLRYEVCRDDAEKVDQFRYNEQKMHTDASHKDLLRQGTMQYGCRPDFQAIFDSVVESWGHVDVGVIVCGPPSLQSSVARECRSQNLKGIWNHPIFHFNSHSFYL